MTAKSHMRGHQIEYVNGEWIYSDNKEVASYERRCIKCNVLPTPEGYDPCLGYVKDAVNACCGHGVGEGYVDYGKDVVLRAHDIDLFVHYPRLYATCSVLNISKNQVDDWVEKIKSNPLCREHDYNNIDIIQNGIKRVLMRMEHTVYFIEKDMMNALNKLKSNIAEILSLKGEEYRLAYLGTLVGIRNAPILLAMLE